MKVIGKGSFGKVTLVRKKNDQRLYAMKVLVKSNIVKRRQVEHTKAERRILESVSHPFIAKMHYAFQTAEKLYFVLDYCAGGELFFHLSRMKKFPEHVARFYCAEITLALEALHANVRLDHLCHHQHHRLSYPTVCVLSPSPFIECDLPRFEAGEHLVGQRRPHQTGRLWIGQRRCQ